MDEIKRFCVIILLKDTQVFIKQVHIMKIETITKDNIKDMNYDEYFDEIESKSKSKKTAKKQKEKRFR